MTIIKGHYDEIHWTECNISEILINEKCRQIEVFIEDSLAVYPPHPLAGKLLTDRACRILIKDVIESNQKISEYDKDSVNKLKPRINKKHSFLSYRDPNKVYEDFSIEGVLLNKDGTKRAWFTWEIIASEFYLDDLIEKS